MKNACSDYTTTFAFALSKWGFSREKQIYVVCHAYHLVLGMNTGYYKDRVGGYSALLTWCATFEA